MHTVMERTTTAEDIQQFINTHPYADEFIIDEDALTADGASVEAFKAYLDRKLLHDGVEKIEDDNRVVYGMRTSISQVAMEGLGFNSDELEWQPWFRRYFSSVTSYEPGFGGEDIFQSLNEWDAQGWSRIHATDDFFPKN